MDIFQGIGNRRSKRAFISQPIPREMIMEVLAAAGRAPSAINLQPWEFTVVIGEEKPRLSRALQKAFRERLVGCSPGTGTSLPEKYKARQFSSFIGLADLLNADAMEVQRFINEGSLDFYGAPAVILVTMEKCFPDTYLTSIGVMLGYLCLAAEAKGLSTCPIGLIRAYEEVVLDFINLEDRHLVVGVAVGYADPNAAVNRLTTPREDPSTLVRWYG